MDRHVEKALMYPLLDTDALVEQSSKRVSPGSLLKTGRGCIPKIWSLKFCICEAQELDFMQRGVVNWLDSTPELLASHVAGQSRSVKSRPLTVRAGQQAGVVLPKSSCWQACFDQHQIKIGLRKKRIMPL
ncbi:hypothetical protein ABBQ38_009488 [Trebouxia sp. C0009 RCD-2024]